MKKAIAALALVMGLFPSPARSQSSIISQIAGDSVATEKLYFSLKFGLNVATLKGTADTGRTGGFNIGLSATIRLTDRLSLGPEITPFSRKGISKIPFGTSGDPALDAFFEDPAAAELDLEYIDIPVLVNYRLGRFHLGAGPFVSFLSDATERFRADLPSGEKLRFRREVAARYRKTDGGLVLEASWTLTKPRRGMGLVFHVRYQRGVIDVFRAALPSGAARNSVIQAYLSFPFVH
jgi:hypothetical protein